MDGSLEKSTSRKGHYEKGEQLDSLSQAAVFLKKMHFISIHLRVIFPIVGVWGAGACPSCFR